MLEPKDLDAFRPELRDTLAQLLYARDLEVAGNVFIGSLAPIAFVTSTDCRVHHNTIIRPEKWVLRILQEQPTDRFRPCRRGRFDHNLVVLDRRVRTVVNIGPNAVPGTFSFTGNAWFFEDRSRRPNLPVRESDGVYQVDPLLRGVDTSAPRIGSEGPRLQTRGAHAYR